MKRLQTFKRYKPLLLQIGILLLILSIVIFFFAQKKQYINIDFSKLYEKNKTIELSGFEEGEPWEGNYSYDTERVMEGNTSITLTSWYAKENNIQKNTNVTLLPGYTNGYMSVYIKDKHNLNSLASFSLELKGEKEEIKKYDLVPLLAVGWNRVPLLIPNWKKITKVTFSVVSKTDTIAELNLDRMWIENTSVYDSDVLATKSKSLSLRTIGARTYLYSSAPTSSETYNLINPPAIQNGYVIVSLIPEHGKEMALSINNTSMKIMSGNINECIVYNNSQIVSPKKLEKTSGKDNLFIFLKATVQNGAVSYSLSNNGLDFETCASTSYSKISPIRLSVEGSYLLDSFSAEY